MPRTAREKSSTGIYHVVMRGINRETIFQEEEDFRRFIAIMQKHKEKVGFKIYAYCLMGNHIHIMIGADSEPLGNVIKRVSASYVLWFNKKYDRVGHLFQERFRSEPIEDDGYFLTCLRYIFQNPVKAGIAGRCDNYMWTNYGDFFTSASVEINYVLDIFDAKREKAIDKFTEFIEKQSEINCLDYVDRKLKSDNEAAKIIVEWCKLNRPEELSKITMNKRKMLIRQLREKHGLSIRQIERLTGINRGSIALNRL